MKPDNIRLIRERKKTQTRRLITPQPPHDTELTELCKTVEPEGWQTVGHSYRWASELEYDHIYKPRYLPGEVVYVKEPWATEKKYNDLAPCDIPPKAHIHFMSDGVGEWPLNLEVGKLRSPMFLKEIFARTLLRIKDVRPERLKDITEEDAKAEGAEKLAVGWRNYLWQEHPAYHYGRERRNENPRTVDSARESYWTLWDSINKPPHDWVANDWVWAYSFSLQESK